MSNYLKKISTIGPVLTKHRMWRFSYLDSMVEY